VSFGQDTLGTSSGPPLPGDDELDAEFGEFNAEYEEGLEAKEASSAERLEQSQESEMPPEPLRRRQQSTAAQRQQSGAAASQKSKEEQDLEDIQVRAQLSGLKEEHCLNAKRDDWEAMYRAERNGSTGSVVVVRSHFGGQRVEGDMDAVRRVFGYQSKSKGGTAAQTQAQAPTREGGEDVAETLRSLNEVSTAVNEKGKKEKILKALSRWK
jgi:hypothetical protein